MTSTQPNQTSHIQFIKKVLSILDEYWVGMVIDKLHLLLNFLLFHKEKAKKTNLRNIKHMH